MGPQLLGRDVAACVTENSPQSAGIEFPVTWDGERLFPARRADTPQLHVASPLSVNSEAKVLQNADHLIP